MLKQTLLISVLGLNALSPVIVNAGPINNTIKQNSLTDSEITKKINVLYHRSPVVKSHDIKVSTNDHTVTLTGEVNTDLQFERAVTLAGSVDGVNDVITENLVIKASKSPMADTVINAKVKGVFLRKGIFESKRPAHWPVKIETKNSVVYLSGSVDSAEHRKELVNSAQHIVGVKSVKSSIKVKS